MRRWVVVALRVCPPDQADTLDIGIKNDRESCECVLLAVSQNLLDLSNATGMNISNDPLINPPVCGSSNKERGLERATVFYFSGLPLGML